MVSVLDEQMITAYVYGLWRKLFVENKVAPLTLIYDPLSHFTGIATGLCSYAHYYLQFDKEFDPDSRVLIYDPQELYYPDETIEDLEKLPPVDCLLINSSSNQIETTDVLSRLNINGIVIILNEVFQIKNMTIVDEPNKLIRQYVNVDLLNKIEKKSEDKVKKIEVFIKS